ncbi:MAG TPA: type II secretion system protein [Pyrinomonadaceae bacterium]|nr:type II secretion system protein [Pyrinomonadaceae bacterium]
MAANNNNSERGMTLLAVMAMMAVFAVALLAVAPSIQQEVQRQKELEAISRGEEVAEAIRQYVEYYRGARLPNSMDDLLDGLPRGTQKRQILRASAAIDPLSEDGKWRLIKADIQTLGPFAKRVQTYNGGTLPPNTSATFDRYAVVIVNSINTGTDADADADDLDSDTDIDDMTTDNQPFIGVASQRKGPSVIAYYGIENTSKWIFTPLFRGTGRPTNIPGVVRPPGAQPPGGGTRPPGGGGTRPPGGGRPPGD